MAVEDMMMQSLGAGAITGLFALGAIMLVFAFVLLVAVYIYTSLAMMTVARKLKAKPEWLAWVPIANLFLMAKMAKKDWWPVLLLIGALIPGIGMLFLIAFGVFYIIWLWKICEMRHKPGWLAVLIIVPFIGGIWGLILWGLLAWTD